MFGTIFDLFLKNLICILMPWHTGSQTHRRNARWCMFVFCNSECWNELTIDHNSKIRSTVRWALFFYSTMCVSFPVAPSLVNESIFKFGRNQWREYGQRYQCVSPEDEEKNTMLSNGRRHFHLMKFSGNSSLLYVLHCHIVQCKSYTCVYIKLLAIWCAPIQRTFYCHAFSWPHKFQPDNLRRHT